MADSKLLRADARSIREVRLTASCYGLTPAAFEKRKRLGQNLFSLGGLFSGAFSLIVLRQTATPAGWRAGQILRYDE
jgi:hypothetical protein